MQALAVETATRLLAVAQPGSGFDVDVSLGQGLAGGAVGAFLTTLVVGAIAVAVFPERTEALMAAVVEVTLPVAPDEAGVVGRFAFAVRRFVDQVRSP